MKIQTTSGMMCTVVQGLGNGTWTFFPVMRKDSWSSTEPTYFSDATLGLVYTLAVLYLINSVFGFYQLGVVVYIRLFRMKAMLTLFIFAFNVVRSIYFWLLATSANTVVESEVSDYTLAVLPTFFYFTAFTLVILVWEAVARSVRAGLENIQSYLRKLFFIVNTILYLLFLGLVLGFQFANSDSTTTSLCGGRADNGSSDENTSSSSKRAVSIVYAVVISAISFVIASAFLFYAGHMFTMTRAMSSLKVASQKNEKTERTYFMTAAVCSVAFILNCVMNLVIAVGEYNNTAFSFVMLLVTEVLPAVSIMPIHTILITVISTFFT